jgi:hypothetical protein
MIMDENFNTMHARIVHSTDDDNDDSRHAPTAFNHASNANNITDTSIVLVRFPLLLNIRDPGEDEDFIGPDGQAIPLPEGFHVAPGTAVDVSRHVDTALTPPTTEDYSIIPVVTNMTQVESDMPPPHPWTGRSLWGSTSGQPLPAGLSWVPVDDAFVNASLQTHTLPATPALIMRLMLPQKIEDW